ncbi:MAG: hypothetical protein QXI59_01800 [Candidatus Bathyarchaeia archaeon]|nr:hypothetical protein [Candidatus Bathyarchaeota archaeon]
MICLVNLDRKTKVGQASNPYGIFQRKRSLHTILGLDSPSTGHVGGQ